MSSTSSSTPSSSMGDRAFFTTAFNQLFIGDPSLTESVISLYFTPSYVQTTDGHTSTYPEFVKHITHLRSIAETLTIEILDFLREGNRIADRHLVTGTMKGKEGVRRFEVYLFGELDEEGKRLERVVEATRMLEGDEGDRDLGRRAE